MAEGSSVAGEASRLLAALAQERGLRVERLTPQLVRCGHESRQVLFWGLAGAGSGRAAQVLCGNDGWLRALFARTGLPVVATRLVDVAGAEAAQREAEALGFPLHLRPVSAASVDHEARDMVGVSAAPEADDRHCESVEAFPAAWRALATTVVSQRDLIILERRPDGEAIEVAVVAGTAIATRRPAYPDPGGSSDEIAAAGSLAVRAVAALPDAGYATVRVVATADGPVIDTVDPTLSGWSGPADPAARRVAEAVLDHEYA